MAIIFYEELPLIFSKTPDNATMQIIHKIYIPFFIRQGYGEKRDPAE